MIISLSTIFEAKLALCDIEIIFINNLFKGKNNFYSLLNVELDNAIIHR